MVLHPLRRLALLAGLMASASLLPPQPARAFTPDEAKTPMTVTLVRGDAADCGADCPEWLALTGVITPATPRLLAAALARIGARPLPVLVDSPGGAVEAAMAMGRAIRARKLDVVVAGTALTECAATDRACAARRRAGERPGFVAGGIAACASACVLLLAAGTERVVGENSYVGVHQMSAKRTFTQTRTMFRVLRRREGNRIVEISRTPISTQTIASRTVQTKAPEALYSQVDRYLLGMGVGEAIMPLMRSALPSSIHWMSQAELAGTHLATDTTDARTMVGRSVRTAAPASPEPSAMALASARIGTGPRVEGIVDWTIERAAAGPVLLGTVDIPERHLHGTVRLRREVDPAATDGYAMAVDVGPATGIEPGRVWTTEAPRICDATVCTIPFPPVAARDDGRGQRDFGVVPALGASFLTALRDRDWISIGLASGDGGHGDIVLSLTQGARAIVADWEHLCCGLAPRGDSRTAPQGTSFTAQADVSLVDARSAATLRTGARLVWTAQGSLDRLVAPGTIALRGALEVPTTDLGVSLAVAPTGDPDLVSIVVTFVPPAKRFGPALSVKVPVVWSASQHVAALTESRGPTADGQGFRIVLSIGEDVPEGASLTLDMTDLYGRNLTVTLPTDGPLRALFRTVHRGIGPAT